MAMPKQVLTGARRYLVLTDVHLPYHVLAWGRVTDAVTQKPPLARVQASTGLAHATVRVFDEGFWCVAGRPDRCFADLATPNNFTVDLSIPGYTTVPVAVAVPANPVWPVDTGTATLNPLPVRVQGRVTAKATGLAIANGKVIAVDPPGAAPAQRPFLLRAPLKQAHTAAASLRGVTLAAVALAPPRVLEADSQLGLPVIVVNDRTGLAVGQVIRFGGAETGEYGRIASVSTIPANPALPGEVRLETGVRKSFPRTTPLSAFSTGAGIGAARAVQSSAAMGEGLLVIDAYPSGDVLQLTEGGLFPEFHAAGGLTGAAGYYRLDGVANIAQMYLGVEAAGFSSPPNPELWIVDYSQAVNVMDFGVT